MAARTRAGTERRSGAMLAEAPVSRAGSEPIRRVATAVVGIPLFLGALIAGGWIWTTLLAGLVILGAWEWLNLTRAASLRPAGEVLIPGAVLLFLLTGSESAWLGLYVLVLVGASVVAQMVSERRTQALANAGATLVGAAYPALLVALDLLRRLPNGLVLTLLTVAVVWVSDAAAYFGGRAWGKRRLAPAISPKKTWEGAFAGLAGGMTAAMVVAGFAGLPPLAAAALGLIVVAAGLAGDLAESALKRSAGVKDTGTLLPGHGGILDRFDALLIAAPAAYLAISLLDF